MCDRWEYSKSKAECEENGGTCLGSFGTGVEELEYIT